MDPAEAYRTFNLSPGAPEGQVRAVHRDMTMAWHPDRFRTDPAMYQQAVAATQRLNAALATIAALGFPLYQQPPAQQAPAYPAPPPQYPPQPVSYVPHSVGHAPTSGKQAGTHIVLGLVLFVVGLAITVGTMDAAEANGGGTYFIAYGPMVWGAILFFKGLFQLGSRR